MNPVHFIEYKPGQKYEFYEEFMVVKGHKIDYRDITGYSYMLKYTRNSIYLIPIMNTYSFTAMVVSTGQKPVTLSRSATNPLFLHTQGQRTVQQVFYELSQCLDTLVGPLVIKKCQDSVRHGEEITVGSLVIGRDYLRKRQFRTDKTLPAHEYDRTVIQRGWVKVIQTNGKTFFSCPLSTVNAPLLPALLEHLGK
jgi:hypothetical protein